MFLFYSVTFFYGYSVSCVSKDINDSSLEVPPGYPAPLAYSNFSKLFFPFGLLFSVSF